MAAPMMNVFKVSAIRSVRVACGKYAQLNTASRSCICSSHYCAQRLYSQSSKGGDESDHPRRGPKSRTDTVKPGQAFEARKKLQEQAVPSPDEQGLDPKLVSAVDTVAKSLAADHQKTKSDLLRKLQQHTVSQEKPKNDTDFSSLLASMQVEKSAGSHDGSRKPTSRQRSSADDRRHTFTEGLGSADHRKRERAPRRESVADQKVFDGHALGVFSTKLAAGRQEVTQKTPTLFDILEREESERLISMPPENRFEEMIQWTKEGKLWKFPIDNEQGMDDEAKVGFHEHVFIEQLIDDRFPSRGPVRQFMELVAVGLSKNPYLTVAEKRAHIAWYADYFKDKYRFIDDAQELLPHGKKPSGSGTVRQPQR